MRLLPLVTCLSFLAEPISARVFTDDQGRQVEAELVGLRGENAVLATAALTGQWPIAKLSAPDRAYVEAWKKDPPTTPSLRIRVWERDGIGPVGVFEEYGGPELPKDIPLLKKTEEKAKYKHYEADITNPSEVDALNAKFAYVLYIIMPDGRVASKAGERGAGAIPSGERKTEATEGISYVRTKTTSTTLNISAGGNLSTGSNVSRSTERFGGAWIRVYATDGSIIGEAKSLTPALEKLDPAWTGPDGDQEIPLIESFDALAKLLEKLPKPPNLPIPGDLPKSPKLPKPPGGFPFPKR